MRPLYIIDLSIEEKIDAAIDPETGEIIDEEKFKELQGLEMEREAKLENIGLYYKDIVAEAEMVRAEKKKLEAREKALDRKAESIKIFFTKALAGEKFKTSRLSVSYSHNTKTEIDDITAIPTEYLKWPDPVVDKAAVKKALKAGKEVPGAHLEPTESTVIK